MRLPHNIHPLTIQPPTRLIIINSSSTLLLLSVLMLQLLALVIIMQEVITIREGEHTPHRSIFVPFAPFEAHLLLLGHLHYHPHQLQRLMQHQPLHTVLPIQECTRRCPFITIVRLLLRMGTNSMATNSKAMHNPTKTFGIDPIPRGIMVYRSKSILMGTLQLLTGRSLWIVIVPVWSIDKTI